MADDSDTELYEEKEPLNDDDSEAKQAELPPTAGYEEEEEEEEEESIDDEHIQMSDIYFIEVIEKQQKEKRGPYTYEQFKKLYQEQSNKGLTYMSPIWNGLEITEWTQLYKTNIFKDIDPERHNELQNRSKSKAKQSNTNTSSLAQPVPLKEYKEMEAKQKEEEQIADKDRPIIEKDAKYDSSSCCLLM